MKLIENLGRTLLMRMDAESAHLLTIRALKSGLISPASGPNHLSLATRLPVSGLVLKNPVGLAAGFDKNAEVADAMLGYGFGFVECGTVTPRPQSGNPRPRLFRLKEDAAVINRMGFNNQGLGVFVRNLVAQRSRAGIGSVIGANVGANKTSEGDARVDDYVAGIKAVWPYCAYLTVNISSPNTPGLRGLQERGALEQLLEAVSAAVEHMSEATGPKPVFLKIAPDIDEAAAKDIVDVALATSGLTGLIVSNTTIARPNTLVSPYREETGGLSGKPLFDASTQVLKWIASAAQNRLDIIGVGGIDNADSAYEKIRAGAHAVQLYSALVYHGSELVDEIREGLSRRLVSDGYTSISEAVGADL